MNQLSLILLFNFKTSLSLEEDIKVAESRIEEFWALKGLQQNITCRNLLLQVKLHIGLH